MSAERGGNPESLSLQEELAKIFEKLVAPLVNFWNSLRGKNKKQHG